MNNSNSRLLKNTLALYSQSFFSLIVSLYTSRVILSALGTEDFGIYTVVAGFVAMVIFMNGALSGSASRFFSFELGKKEGDLSRVFTSVFTIHLIFAILMAIVLQTVGLWFVTNKLVIPLDRLDAAVLTLHFATANAVLTILLVPANALLIAHEKMTVYAYMGVFQVVTRLVAAVLISRTSFDTLVFFGALLLLFSFISFLIYHLYCNNNFKEYKVKVVFDSEIQRAMFSYTGWTVIGSFSGVMKLQGIDMLLNIFFGPVVNASRGIAIQINNALYSLIVSFTQALNPQITKSYAANDIDNMLQLLNRGARLSFYLFFIISLPVLINTEYILQIWLGSVPPQTAVFTRLIIIDSLIQSFAPAFLAAIHATGKIRNPQIVVGSLLLLNIPVSYLFLRLGFSPAVVLVVGIVIDIIALFSRLFFLKALVPAASLRLIIGKIFIPSSLVVFVSSTVVFVLIGDIRGGFIGFVLSSLLAISVSGISVWFLGLGGSERTIISTIIREKSLSIFRRG